MVNDILTGYITSRIHYMELKVVLPIGPRAGFRTGFESNPLHGVESVVDVNPAARAELRLEESITWS